MARKRKGIALNGIIIINKPYGLSSNQALQRIKKAFNAQKAGHTGSLDPLATGVLPICFGQATRISQYLLDANKSYEATIQLGISTDSGDIEGQVIRTSDIPVLDEETINTTLQRFIGQIKQVPPMYSALKHQGVPLYEFARKGIEIERKPRVITIFALKLIDYDAYKHTINIDVHCSKGTYIRTLGMDIAQALGTDGHLTKLTRTQCGLLSSQIMLEIDNLEQLTITQRHSRVLNTECVFTDTPIFTIPCDAHSLFYSKGKLQLERNFSGIARIYDQGHFVAIGYFEQGNLIKKQLFLQGIINNGHEIHN
ncbi:tRNA pseudouridine(55) synthase TruB [Fastidiosibacter lacustris]|uniref:tRNA pseudouridine(55) synthase TruB n=1 Tax=Fastidiosibacter lacustris TaxID=2056695 RepID=UPI000E34A3AB|nr:tRNA pseudouridine(55) synthase TruB [Fastidiosibacter lacustris]